MLGMGGYCGSQGIRVLELWTQTWLLVALPQDCRVKEPEYVGVALCSIALCAPYKFAGCFRFISLYEDIHMDIRLLTYFLTVARTGNITRAAEQLHITQPTLSRQMQELEEELDTELLERGKRKTTLTPAGELLKERAEEIVSLVDKTKTDVMTSTTGIKGDIYIGCAETYAMRTVAEAIHNFDEDGVQVHLTSGNEE